MKKLRKIETNRPPISDADISNTKKGFDEVLSKYNSGLGGTSGGGFSLMGWGAGILTTVIIGTGIWFISSNYSESLQNNPQNALTANPPEDSLIAKNQKINPPFPDKLKFEEFEINPTHKNTLKTSNGTQIYIPSNSFVDADGNPVDDNVIIKFKDYHDPVDVFLSGIPMGYDSAGTNYTFETAGMFQIFAEQKGDEIYLAKGKSIDVEFNSKSEIQSNIYYYDTISNSWSYNKSEKAEDIAVIEDKKDNIEKQIEDYTYQFNEETGDNYNVSYGSSQEKKNKAIPKEKRKIHDNLKQFIVKVKDQNGNSKIIELLPNQNFKDEYYSVTWTSTKLIKQDNNLYTVVLQKDKKEFRFLGKEQTGESAAAVDKSLDEINSNKQKRIELQSELANKIEKLRVLQNDFSTALMNGFSTQRIMTINRLGTWNCDRPLPMPEMAEPGNMQFFDAQNNVLDYKTLNIAQVHKNVLWNYPNTLNWYYSSRYDNILWFVTTNNKIAIVEPPAFSLGKTQKQVVVKVFEVDEGLAFLRKYFS